MHLWNSTVLAGAGVLAFFSSAVAQVVPPQPSFDRLFPIPQQGNPHNGEKNAAYTVEELTALNPLPEQAWVIGQIKDITPASGGNGTEVVVYLSPSLKAIVDLTPIYARMGVVDGAQTSVSSLAGKTIKAETDAKTVATRDGVMLTSIKGIKTRNLGDLKKGGTILVGLNFNTTAGRVVCSGIFASYKAPASITDQQKPAISPMGIPVPKK